MSIYHLLSLLAKLTPKDRDDWELPIVFCQCTVNHLFIYESFICTLATFAYIE